MVNIFFSKFENKFFEFKNDFLNSKKYWVIYLVLILSYSIFMFHSENYFNINGVIFLFLLSIIGVFCISYFYGHNADKEIYKSAFIIILIFGIVLSVVTPIMFIDDEIEHFVRAEMTSRGEFIPEYDATPYEYGGTIQRGYYLTIQSTLDLIDDFRIITCIGYDFIPFSNVSTIYGTDADTKSINYNLVKYHSAFAQNPFYGYLVPALGMLVAKLLNLNAIWLLWLGRIGNAILYAVLAALAIKKTPILKVPLLFIATMPLILMQSASLSIDSLINGLGIFSIAYFFNMCYSRDLTHKHIIKFSIIVLALGLCKITYFSLILLLIFVPMDNFKNKKYYLLGFLSIIILSFVSLLWSKYYANPLYINSYRFVYNNLNNVNSIKQLDYILSHKMDMLLNMLLIIKVIPDFLVSWVFNKILFLFLILSCLLYPIEYKFKFKTKFGALLVFFILYFGTFLVFILTWTPVGKLFPNGVQTRYFYPVLCLIPFVFGINHNKFDKSKVDSYLVMISITFIIFNLIMLIVNLY